MKFTILGSGGCVPIPKPLCQCSICKEARRKGVPYSRTGSSAFLDDINLLIDTPPQIFDSLNNVNIEEIDYLIYTHLDNDHFDGHSVLVACFYDGTEYCYKPKKSIDLVVPEKIDKKLSCISGQYGNIIESYIRGKLITKRVIEKVITISNITIIAIFVEGNRATSYIYLFIDENGKKILYAPCDIKPFPIDSEYVYDVDVFITQPGYFETGLKNDFVYPLDDHTRIELYSIDETLEIAKKIRAKKIVFTHLEEYWNRNYDQFKELEKSYTNVKFAFDGMVIEV